MKSFDVGLAGLVFTCFLAMAGTTHAQTDPETVRLEVRWLETRPEQGIFTPFFVLAFHQGEIDFYDHERPVSGRLDELISVFRSGGSLQPLLGAWNLADAPAQFHGMSSSPQPHCCAFPTPPPLTPQFQRASVAVDPRQHRFFSYAAYVAPSDDAFVGNEEPFEIELFNAEGRFAGPLYIDVFGSQVLDAGLCANREADLMLLDWAPPAPNPLSPCEDGEGLVLPHPGLNGSQRNPHGEPKRVLGGHFDHDRFDPVHYDTVAADFSRPGYKLGRLMITRADASRFSPTGSWYSPARDGEGFNIEVVEARDGDSPPRMLVYWYTYEPDGSGRQVWLSGLAEMHPQQGGLTRVELIRSEGGRFASTDNPDLVERSPWGHVDLSFQSCTEGLVRYRPLDPAWPAGEYPIYRLSPQIEGLGWQCAPQAGSG